MVKKNSNIVCIIIGVILVSAILAGSILCVGNIIGPTKNNAIWTVC